MTNKKTRIAVLSVVAVLLVMALVLSLTAVMSAKDSLYVKPGSGIGVVPAATTSYGGLDGVAKDGTLSQKGSGATTGYTEIGGTSGNDFSMVRSNPEGNYILMGDITVNSVDTSTTFKGILDGNGYTVKLEITNRSTNSEYVGGLFAYLSGGTVKNLTVAADTFIVGTDQKVANCGVMFGQINGGTVENVCVELNHSPSQADDNDNNDSYFFTNYEADSGCITRLGAIAGVTVGTVLIQDTTVENNATGSYGFVTRTRTKAGSKILFVTTYSYSDVMLGGFIGMAGTDDTSTSLSFNRVTLAGSADSKMTTHSASTDSYRKNRGMLGGLVSYDNNGEIEFNNVIISYPIINLTNADGSTNINNTNYYGTIIAYCDDNMTISAKNLYFNASTSDAEDLLIGRAYSLSGVTVFPTTAIPRFDGESNIAFYGAKKVAPDSSELVAYIEHAGQKQNVMTSLMLKEGESEETVWLSVPIVEHSADGKNYSVNISAEKAGQGSIKLESDTLVFSGSEDGAYTATKYYDAANVQSPVVALYDSGSQKVYSVEGAYTCENSIQANAEYVAQVDIDRAIATSEYKTTVYNGVTYIYSENAGYVYSPQNGIQVGDGAIDLDLTKDIQVEVLPAPLTVDAAFVGNEITYYDGYYDILGKIMIKEVSGKYYASAMIVSLKLTTESGEYTQGMPAGTAVNVKIDGIELTDGNSNYSITYGEGADKVVQHLVLDGSIEGVDGIEYDGLNHMSAEYVVGGDYPFEYSYAYTDGEGLPVEEVINAGSYVVSVTVSDENVILNNATLDFEIAPKKVEILVEDVAMSHDYNRGVFNPSELFKTPVDIDGEALAITVESKLGEQASVIQHAGEYTVTAKLNEYDNYVADDVTVTYTVNKVVLEIATEQAADKLTSVYDGEAMTAEEKEALFTAPDFNGQEILFTVSDTEVINVGEYVITAQAAIPVEEQGDFVIEDASVTFTVTQAVVGGSIVVEATSVYDGSAKEAVFLVEGNLYGSDAIVLTYFKDNQPVAQAIDAGEYTVTASLPEYTEGKSNYKWADGVTDSAQFTVERMQVSVTANGDSGKVYDGEAFADVEGLFVFPVDINGEALSYDITITKDGMPVDEIKDAGAYTVTATLSLGQDNYVSDSASLNYTVEKVVVDGSLVFGDMTYDGTEKGAEFVFAGDSPMIGDDAVILEYGEGDRVNYGASVTVNAVLPSDNYEFASEAVTQGTIAVERITVDGSLVLGDMTYDGKEKTAVFEFSGESPMVGSDRVTVEYDEGDRINVGEAVGVRAVLPSSNYVFAESADVTAEIQVVPVEFAIDFGTYGTSTNGVTVVVGTEFVFGAKIEGTVDNNVTVGDNQYSYSIVDNGWVDGDYTTSASAGEVFTLSLTLTVDGLAEANYTYPQQVQVRVIATSMGGTLVADKDSVVYDGTAYGATLTGTVEGVEESDYRIEYALVGSYDWTSEKPVNAGEYKVRVVSLTEDYSSDQIADITFTIEKAEAVVIPTVGDSTLYEGHALPEIILAEGSTAGNIAWLDGEQTLVAGAHEYEWTFVSSDPNYKDASGRIQLTAQEVVFDRLEIEKNQSFKSDYVYGDVFYTDGITVKAIYNDGSEKVLSSDEYTVEALTTGATSVKVTYGAESASAVVEGITVDKKSVEIPVVNGEYVYDASEQKADVTTSELYDLGGDLAAKAAGTYTITATLKDSANYKWTDSDEASVLVIWTIAKKSASITADSVTVTYGDVIGAFTAKVSGAAGDDVLEYTVGVQSAPEIFVKGEYAIVVTLTPDSAVNANYEITLNGATLTVNAKEIKKPEVDTSQSFVYDGSEKTFVVPEGEGYAVSGNTATNAGDNYTVVISLTDKENTVWAGGSSDDLTYAWSIAKGTRELSASTTLGYKYIAVSADNLSEVEYSSDGEEYKPLTDGKIAVDFALNYTVYLRYMATDNYVESKAVKVDLTLTKAVLKQYIDEEFGEEFTFADVDRYLAVKKLAESAQGESQEFDNAMAALDAKYEALIAGAKDSAEQALGAGATLAGRKLIAAAALSLTGAGAGIAIAALCVKSRKGGKKNED